MINICPSLLTKVNCCAGAEQMCNAVEEITGHRPWLLYKLCWRYFTPLLSMVSFTHQEADLLFQITIVYQTYRKVFSVPSPVQADDCITIKHSCYQSC